MNKIVTRIPPSPTGHLHIGTARTALFNYLFARKHGGTMLFRSEDTDRERSKSEYEAEILEGLRWLGLQWDNTKIVRQSERTALYRGYLEKMIASGTAYVSEEESKKQAGEMVAVVRLKNPNKEITFTDLVRGEITFDTTELGDLVIARSLDDPLYHLTVVIDDYEMGVTHVLRGEDHISNTPRQILIQEAVGAPRPAYAHLPLILAPDRSKMSKRHGAVSLIEYRNEGFLPNAIVNYLALLGWNPGTDQEIFTMEQLIEQFSIDHIQKSGAVFDRAKFEWINKEHLAQLPDTAYLELVHKALTPRLTELPQFSTERLERLLPVIRERVHTMHEFIQAAEEGEYDFAFAEPMPDPALIKWKNDATAADAAPRLERVTALLETADFSTPDTIKAVVWPYAEEAGKGEVLWPLRVALTGRERSPDPFMCAFILGREETLARVKRACDTMVLQ